MAVLVLCRARRRGTEYQASPAMEYQASPMCAARFCQLLEKAAEMTVTLESVGFLKITLTVSQLKSLGNGGCIRNSGIGASTVDSAPVIYGTLPEQCR